MGDLTLAQDETQAIEDLLRTNGGRITAEQLLDEAADEDHPLHDRFTWDDTEAAHRYRITEARAVIRSYYVIVNQQPLTSGRPRVANPTRRRGLVRDPDEKPHVQGYIRRADALSEVSSARAYLRQEIAPIVSRLRGAGLDAAKAAQVSKVYRDALHAVDALWERLQD